MEDELSFMKEEAQDITSEQKELIYNRLEELKRSNAALLAENDMFEHFIARLDPRVLGGHAVGQGLGAAVSVEAVGHGHRRRSRHYISDPVHELTLEQKLYVAQREITATQLEQEKLRRTYEKIQDNYKASLKEAEIRLSEINKAKTEFERRLRPMKDNRLEMKKPEKILQYIEDKSKFSLLEKYNLKTQMLKVQEKKLQQQLQQKKEMTKAEYEETFHDYDEQRIDKNLHELQVNSLKVQQNLSSHKEKLQRVTQESTELSNDITNRKLLLAKIEEDLEHVEEERLKAEALNQHLHRQMAAYQAPDITDYIHVKDKRKKLRQSIHIWERKVAIAEMALKSHTKAWNTQSHAFTPANTAAAEARAAAHHMRLRLPNIR
ncbi:coiled-coil domain-containing protein 113 isoform X2 [Betta splendens]|uniref:Cilia- and flagella-associated protein 263 n=1 Tax=Betta splendens TaxID=158456 RepID=A0A6P7MUC6_BETSP|nr:coiled-coil domain-containing protein 113 isoform X2 [Betta splendens]